MLCSYISALINCAKIANRVMKMVSVAVIVLTKDEELHIERCLRNVLQISDEVYVVDSESTDRTCEIAERFGATVVEHPWPGNQAEQFN